MSLTTRVIRRGSRLFSARTTLASLAVLFLSRPGILAAQSGLPEPGSLGSQSLRGYTHMFVAYALVWLILLGWLIYIGIRLGRVAKSLEVEEGKGS